MKISCLVNAFQLHGPPHRELPSGNFPNDIRLFSIDPQLLSGLPDGVDTRFVVTNLDKKNPCHLYEGVYCRRGQAEDHIKSWKTHLCADRTSCMKATANQLRLFLHAGAYWILWGLRVAAPKRSVWRTARFDTLRLRLIKIAARVVELKTTIKIHLPSACPDQQNLRVALDRIPRLAT